MRVIADHYAIITHVRYNVTQPTACLVVARVTQHLTQRANTSRLPALKFSSTPPGLRLIAVVLRWRGIFFVYQTKVA